MSVTKFVDNIIVMDNGKIVEFGNHIELMNNKDKYFNMFTAQAQFYQKN